MRKKALQNKLTLNSYSSNSKQTAERLLIYQFKRKNRLKEILHLPSTAIKQWQNEINEFFTTFGLKKTSANTSFGAINIKRAFKKKIRCKR